MRQRMTAEPDKLDHPISGARDGIHSCDACQKAVVGCPLDPYEAKLLRVRAKVWKKIAHFVLINSDTISPFPTESVVLFFSNFSSPSGFSSRVMRVTDAVLPGTVMPTSMPSGAGL